MEITGIFFYDWWAENTYMLENGLPGDVLNLRDRLNEAFAEASKRDKR
jgi:hypothetical protein